MKLSFHIFFFIPLSIFFTFRIVHKKAKEHHLFLNNELIDILRSKKGGKNNGYLCRCFNRYRFTKWSML